MNNILIGNGFDIEIGGVKECSNAAIIERVHKNIEKKYGEPDLKTKYIYVFPDKNNIKRKINVFCMESDINSVSLSVLDLDKSI